MAIHVRILILSLGCASWSRNYLLLAQLPVNFIAAKLRAKAEQILHAFSLALANILLAFFILAVHSSLF